MPKTNLRDKVSSIPNLPGIYFFKNEDDEIIYIGKSKFIRKRVQSYFSFKGQKKDAKTSILVANVTDIDWLVVRSEAEALLAESNLIKEHRPKYNVFLKDDKTYPYIKITNEFYPRIEIIRMKDLKKDENIYFGPYTDTYSLREVLKAIHRIFPLRTCSFYIDSKSIKDKKHSLCLDYHIKRCDGPCEGLVKQSEYAKMINEIKLFLQGKRLRIREYVKSSMDKASKELRYEDAAIERDRLMAIDNFLKKQKKISHDFVDRDLVCIASKGKLAIAIVVSIRNGHLIGKNCLELNIAYDSEISNSTSSFIRHYYNSPVSPPKEIVLDVVLRDKSGIKMWFAANYSTKIDIITPLRGERLSLIKMCRKNADLKLKEMSTRKIKHKKSVPMILESLQNDIGLSVPPIRIEAFDNSNIQGKHPVAGMVLFVNGKPKKNGYRKFKIKNVKGIDDFAMMREVVERRYTRSLKENIVLPDLILIDGGKGQLSAAKSALDTLGLGYLPVIGLAKRLEEVFKPGLSEPQNITKTSPGLHLLKKVRDEVHRYAITFHRKSRSKEMTKSVFDDIRGMGPSRVNRLWREYSTITEISKLSEADIINKIKVSKNIAKKIIEKSIEYNN